MVREAMGIERVICAEVDVPKNWTIAKLKAALARRRIKLHNDQDVVDVFGKYIELKQELRDSIRELEAKEAKLKKKIEKITLCPHCLKGLKVPASQDN